MSIGKHSFIYGMAAVIIVIAYSLTLYLVDMHNPALNYISYLLYIGVVVYALRNWRDKEKGGELSYGQAMGYSTLLALFYCIVIAIWTYIFMTYIAPGMMESEMLKQEMKMEAKGMPREQIEMAMKYARIFSRPPIATTMAFIFNAIILTIINLIVSAVMRRDKPASFDQGFMPPPNPLA